MENATQALLIAGGILLAILTLTTLVYMFSNMATIGNTRADKEELERLRAWNAEWEAYNKRVLYGAGVLTVMNKAEQNNNEYENDTAYEVKILVFRNSIEQTKDDVATSKSSIFKCTSVEYNHETGRINKMVFEFVE